ncbi:hypothetical protein Tco_0100707, partial [Tanacetum coccineum]
DTQDRQTQIFQSVEALVDDRQYHYETNNMPPRRTLAATARAAAATRAAAPMTAAAVEQLIEARVSAVLSNNE